MFKNNNETEKKVSSLKAMNELAKLSRFKVGDVAYYASANLLNYRVTKVKVVKVIPYIFHGDNICFSYKGSYGGEYGEQNMHETCESAFVAARKEVKEYAERVIQRHKETVANSKAEIVKLEKYTKL